MQKVGMIPSHVLDVVHERSRDVADAGGTARTVPFAFQRAKFLYERPSGRHLECASDAARRAQ